MDPGASQAFPTAPVAKIRAGDVVRVGVGGHTTGHLSTGPQTRVPSPGQDTFLVLRASRYPGRQAKAGGRAQAKGALSEPPLAADARESPNPVEE